MNDPTNTPDPDDALRAALRDGSAWDAFCDRLKAAGRLVQAVESVDRERELAEGYRYLTRLARMGLELILENGTPAAPALFYQNPTLKSGGDNPDNLYYWGRIRGTHRYRLDIELQPNVDLSIIVYAGGLNRDGGRRTVGELSLAKLHRDADGRCVVHLGGEPRTRNWLPLSEDAGTLLIRETVANRREAIPSRFAISCLDGHPPPPLDALAMAKALRSVGGYVDYSIRYFAQMAEQWQHTPNRFFATDASTVGSSFADSRYQYPSCYFSLQDDEVLLLEFTPPAGCFWNVVLSNHWFESLDYLHYPVHVNPLMHAFAPDAPVRIAIAARDPGLPGYHWLDTTGHRQGILNVRFVDAPPQPLPELRVVRTDRSPA